MKGLILLSCIFLYIRNSSFCFPWQRTVLRTSVKQTMENAEALLKRLREYTVRVQWRSKGLVIPLSGEYRDC